MSRLAGSWLVMWFGLAACVPTPEPLEEHACAGTWGVTAAEQGVIYVDPSSDDGDGTLAAPLPTLGAALQQARSSGDRTIALTPGTYRPLEANRSFNLSAEFGDDGLVLAGCGAQATVLEGIEALPQGTTEDTPGAEEELQRVIDVYGGVQGVEIRDLAVTGGRRGVVIREDAGAEQPIVLARLRVEDNLRVGIVVEGVNTSANLLDVEVVGTEPDEDGSLGYGVLVQALADPWVAVDGEVRIEGGRVAESTGVGLLVDRAVVEIVDLEVSDTAPLDGSMGRGIQLQNSVVGLLERLTVRDNSDTGLFLQTPLDVTVRDSLFAGTARATIPGLADDQPSGDGLCATQADTGTDPALWIIDLEGNAFEDNGRAGALAEGITVRSHVSSTFSGNGLMGDAETFPLAPDVDALYLQGGAVVEAGDGVELGGGGPWAELELHRDALELDDLGE